MHDLVHDIASAVSNHQNKESNPNNWSTKSGRKLRTLFCNNEETLHKIGADTISLRVLVLHSSGIINLSNIIGKLIHFNMF